MIDPCIWESEQVQSLSPAQFKLYIFMISQADDDGRLKVSIPLFKTRVHPLDEYSIDNFRSDMEMIITSGLMLSYRCGTDWYMAHPNWRKYQYIQKAIPSKLPAPEKGEATLLLPYSSGTPINQMNRIELNGKEENIPQKKLAPEKHHVAENVLMTDDEVEKLKAKFPDYEKRIQGFSLSKMAHGYKYKSDYAAVLLWARREAERGGNGTNQKSGDPETERLHRMAVRTKELYGVKP